DARSIHRGPVDRSRVARHHLNVGILPESGEILRGEVLNGGVGLTILQQLPASRHLLDDANNQPVEMRVLPTPVVLLVLLENDFLVDLILDNPIWPRASSFGAGEIPLMCPRVIV